MKHCLPLITLCLLAPASVSFGAQGRNWTPQMARAVGFVDVTQAPYFAKGDGKTDDTRAIQQAIFDHIYKYDTLYLPDGTYLVSGTLRWQTKEGEWACGLAFQGQSRAGVVLKLKDSTFTDPKHPQPVIITASGYRPESHSSGGNNAFGNLLYGFTVDTGRGNAGAVGLDYIENNWGGIGDLAIRSSDPARVGVAGISLLRGWPGPCLFKNVSVSGFDYGIQTGNPASNVVLVDIALRGQRVAGIRNDLDVLTVENLRSVNTVPAVVNVSDWPYGRSAFALLLNARLSGGTLGVPAIDNPQGYLYLRNVKAAGYREAVRDAGRDVPGLALTEWTSDAPVRLFPSPPRSLGLPVEPTPDTFDPDFRHWKSVVEFGARPDDDGFDCAPAIQRAIDSGATTLYFPKGGYHVRSTIVVRGAVRHLFGGGSSLLPAAGHTFTDAAHPRPVLRFQTGTAPAVLVERLSVGFAGVDGAVALQDGSRKTVAIRTGEPSGGAAAYHNEPGAGPLFLEDVSTQSHGHGTWHFDHPQDVWARQLNVEQNASPMIENRGGRLWILGLKTEDVGIVIETAGGGSTELLGGFFYPRYGGDPLPADLPALVNRESRLSAVYVLNENSYDLQVRETRGGVTRDLRPAGMPGGGKRCLPLYTGYRVTQARKGQQP